MSLASGTKLGVYEILSPLGAGGMGEVYRARDTKLQRDVALMRNRRSKRYGYGFVKEAAIVSMISLHYAAKT